MHTLNDYLIPQYQPDLVTLWLTEPDHAQHVHGLASPKALAMLREIDEDVYQFIGALEGAAPDGLNCLVISDHGFSTANSHVEPERELTQAGLIDSPDSHEMIRASDSLYLRGHGRERLFLRDDLLSECPGAMPQSAVLGNHPHPHSLGAGLQRGAHLRGPLRHRRCRAHRVALAGHRLSR